MTALIRTFCATLILAGVVLLIFWRLTIDERQRSLDELAALNERLEQQIERQQAMLERLSRTRRVAHVKILDQRHDEAGDVRETELVLIELDDEGREIARQFFTIRGQMLFIDAWTVKFDPDHVAEGHPLHGRSLVLLRRIYSDRVAAIEGIPIDTPGAIPPAYADSDIGRYEQQIWKHFWELATDWRRAKQMGVRVAQGEVVYKPVETGQRYELVLDAVGGLSLMPIDPDGRAYVRVDE